MIGCFNIDLNNLPYNLQLLEVNKRWLDHYCGDRNVGLEDAFNADRIAILDFDRRYSPLVTDRLTGQESTDIFSLSCSDE